MKDAPSLLTQELAASVKQDFASQQMDCAVLGCYLTLTDPNEEDRQKTHAIYHAHLKFSRMMNAGVVGTETPAPKGTDPHTEDAFQFFIQCFFHQAGCKAGGVHHVARDLPQGAEQAGVHRFS